MNLSLLQIRERFVKAIDDQYNVTNMGLLIDALDHLEVYPMSTIDLEETRFGKYVNEVRRRSSDKELSKRLKALVKTWQGLISAPVVELTNGHDTQNAKLDPADDCGALTRSPMHGWPAGPRSIASGCSGSEDHDVEAAQSSRPSSPFSVIMNTPQEVDMVRSVSPAHDGRSASPIAIMSRNAAAAPDLQPREALKFRFKLNGQREFVIQSADVSSVPNDHNVPTPGVTIDSVDSQPNLAAAGNLKRSAVVPVDTVHTESSGLSETPCQNGVIASSDVAVVELTDSSFCDNAATPTSTASTKRRRRCKVRDSDTVDKLVRSIQFTLPEKVKTTAELLRDISTQPSTTAAAILAKSASARSVERDLIEREPDDPVATPRRPSGEAARLAKRCRSQPLASGTVGRDSPQSLDRASSAQPSSPEGISQRSTTLQPPLSKCKSQADSPFDYSGADRSSLHLPNQAPYDPNGARLVVPDRCAPDALRGLSANAGTAEESFKPQLLTRFLQNVQYTNQHWRRGGGLDDVDGDSGTPESTNSPVACGDVDDSAEGFWEGVARCQTKPCRVVLDGVALAVGVTVAATHEAAKEPSAWKAPAVCVGAENERALLRAGAGDLSRSLPPLPSATCPDYTNWLCSDDDPSCPVAALNLVAPEPQPLRVVSVGRWTSTESRPTVRGSLLHILPYVNVDTD